MKDGYLPQSAITLQILKFVGEYSGSQHSFMVGILLPGMSDNHWRWYKSSRLLMSLDDTLVVSVDSMSEEDGHKSQEIADEANVSTSFSRILTHTFCKRYVAARLVPQQLTEEHEATCKRIPEELIIIIISSSTACGGLWLPPFQRNCYVIMRLQMDISWTEL
jgi:hypothetical protein